MHAEYAIGTCIDGLEAIYYRGATHRAGPGTVVIIEADEVHTGAPDSAATDSFSYRVMYPHGQLFDGPTPHFPDLVLDDPWLARRLRAVHRDLVEPGADRLEAECGLVEMLDELVRRHAARPVGGHPAGAAGAAGAPRSALASRVMTRLGDDSARPPSLADLAAEFGLSRYQVLRGFTSEVGLPPYAWLAQHRVARARPLLERGARPAQVAVTVGFADQAHLTRWFRRVLGVTPSAYRNSVQASEATGRSR
jgi:AraC-like DNA-binding protein